MKRIDREIDKLFGPIIKQRNSILYRIVKGWKQIVGPSMAVNTNPIKLTNNKDSTTLHINCIHASIATEIFYNEPLIIEKIAFFLGQGSVTNLKIKTYANVSKSRKTSDEKVYNLPEHIRNLTKDIQDAELHLALNKLIEIYRPHSWIME